MQYNINLFCIYIQLTNPHLQVIHGSQQVVGFVFNNFHEMFHGIRINFISAAKNPSNTIVVAFQYLGHLLYLHSRRGGGFDQLLCVMRALYIYWSYILSRHTYTGGMSWCFVVNDLQKHRLHYNVYFVECTMYSIQCTWFIVYIN